MSLSSPVELELAAQLSQRLAAALNDGTFIRLVLSPGANAPGGVVKVLGRCIQLRGQPHLSLTFRYPTRDEVKNLPIAKVTGWVLPRLGREFTGALLSTTQGDWQLSMAPGKRPRLIRHKAAGSVAPSREHDERHRSLLGRSAHDWLSGLGVTDRAGKVFPTFADKYTQISRFLEIFSHLAKDAGWIGSPPADATSAPWTIVDLGSGKGYLTFGLWHLLHRVWALPARVIGVEARAELVAKTNELAKNIGAHDLDFLCGTIESVELPQARAFIALHACDTATDDALLRGIDLSAQLILVAPCCHQAVRPQFRHPLPLAPVLRHGIMEERMAEWATDGLRALFLEWAGYRTKVFEFVSSEHTAKNLMIAAVREGPAFGDLNARKRVEEFKAYFGLARHALDPLLDRQPVPGTA